MKADDIAHGLRKAVEAGTAPESAVAALTAFLKRKGALSLFPNILNAYTRIQARENRKKPVLRVAKQEDADSILSSHDAVRNLNPDVLVDSTLIGGYVLNNGTQRTDASHKGALLNLYHKITSTEVGK
jgi:F0F1-type ATP synthase delta subunit